MSFPSSQDGETKSEELKSAATGKVRRLALHVVLNDRVEATIDVDTMATKSCTMTGILENLRLNIPVVSQRLPSEVRFTRSKRLICPST